MRVTRTTDPLAGKEPESSLCVCVHFRVIFTVGQLDSAKQHVSRSREGRDRFARANATEPGSDEDDDLFAYDNFNAGMD